MLGKSKTEQKILSQMVINGNLPWYKVQNQLKQIQVNSMLYNFVSSLGIDLLTRRTHFVFVTCSGYIFLFLREMESFCDAWPCPIASTAVYHKLCSNVSGESECPGPIFTAYQVVSITSYK